MPAHSGRQTLETQTAHLLDALRRELGPGGEADRVTALGRHHYERLLAHATITDYVPLLVYRSTREELLAARRKRERQPPSEARLVPGPVHSAA